MNKMTYTARQRTVGLKRLLRLAAFLRKVPSRRFGYANWASSNWRGKSDLSCGASACALGWATTMPFFRRLGLRLLFANGTIVVIRKGSPTNGGHAGSFFAAAAVFYLTVDEAKGIFQPGIDIYGTTSPGVTAGPKQVANHIDCVVDTIAKKEQLKL